MALEAEWRDVEDRNIEINTIHQQVLDINRLFRDVDTLVTNQKEVIDHIALDISSSVNFTHQAAAELTETDNHYQRCSIL